MQNRYSIEAILNPRETLSELEQQTLLESLIPVTRDGFGTPVETDDIKNHVLGVDAIYVARFSGGAVVFGSFDHLCIAGERVLYLSGTVFESRHQKKGLLGKILDQAITDANCRYIATRTQNPVIYICLLRRCAVLYPGGIVKPPEPFRSIALAIAQRLGMKSFDPETFVEVGTYGGCMTATEPRYEGEERKATETFAKIGLKPGRGDAAIFVGQLQNPLVL